MRLNKSIIITFTGLCLWFCTSCEDYLDRTPDSDLTEEQIFGNYKNFQGFLDLLYGDNLIQYLNQTLTATLDVGDDVACNKTFPSSYTIPNGDYWWVWRNFDHNMFNKQKDNDATRGGFWTAGWYNIRRANLGLKNMDLMIGATEEEINLIKGQLYFFRAWNHFEIARCWGGLPYLDTYLEPDDDMKLPRLTYKQTLMKVIEDLDRAAALLPLNWDETEQGKASPGSNTGRVTKGAALAAKARAYLYAASPLTTKMESGSPEYDIQMCEKAAEAAWEVIKLQQQGIYDLVPWAQYADNFASNATGSNSILTKEIIWTRLKGQVGNGQVTNGIGRIHNSQRFGGNGVVTSPTLNMVELYETATGYAIEDAPTSDYNPLNPWVKRDPRFLKTILTDGVKWAEKTSPTNAFVQLYTGGLDMNANNASVTGFLIRKYIPYGVNTNDAKWANYRFQVPFIRLAEMYLIYAEAANEAYGPKTAPSFATLTAEEAINTIRRRVLLPTNEDLTKPAELFTSGTASMPDVLAQYTVSKEVFRERIRNERSVELAYEGHRWFDLRRWYVAHLPEHKIRYKCDFDKNHTYFNKVKLFEGPFDEKHYWLPFKREDVNLYEGFTQNPGWE